MALAESALAGRLPAEIVLVVSNVRGSGGIARARELGVRALEIPHAEESSRAAHEARVLAALEEAGIDWVCLAGYMRLLSRGFVERFRERILNIHPSLLPAFPGLHPQRQAIEAGVKLSGCTVHLVDAGLDSGPIVLQRAVPVLDGDDEEALAARILEEEHRAYPEALQRLLVTPWRVEGRRLSFEARREGG